MTGAVGAVRALLARRAVVVGLVVVALLAGALSLRSGPGEKTLVAHFPEAVSIYPGSEVRVLGVQVGTVTAVVPDGASVRVEMTYDADVKVPADARAAIITPTLVSDRFVQLSPAWTSGPVMADGGDIALPDTGVPVELDRIYASLRDLTVALGPNGINKDGTLDRLLRSGQKALDGQGQAGHDMITQLSAAATTFGEGSGDLFATVDQLAQFSDTLATGDRTVRLFLRRFAAVTRQLSGERVALRQALASVAGAVGTVQTFVRENRDQLAGDLDQLSKVVRTIASERESLDLALAVAPVALGNLSVAFNNAAGTENSRIGIQGNTWGADDFLCGVVQQSDLPGAQKDLACQVFTALIQPAEDALAENAKNGSGISLPSVKQSLSGPALAKAVAQVRAAQRAAAVRQQQGVATYADSPADPSLAGLVGGAS